MDEATSLPQLQGDLWIRSLWPQLKGVIMDGAIFWPQLKGIITMDRVIFKRATKRGGCYFSGNGFHFHHLLKINYIYYEQISSF